MQEVIVIQQVLFRAYGVPLVPKNSPVRQAPSSLLGEKDKPKGTRGRSVVDLGTFLGIVAVKQK